MLKSYTTLEDAVHAEIIAPLEALGTVKNAREEFDVEALTEILISRRVDSYGRLRFSCPVDEDLFWHIVSDWHIEY